MLKKCSHSIHAKISRTLFSKVDPNETKGTKSIISRSRSRSARMTAETFGIVVSMNERRVRSLRKDFIHGRRIAFFFFYSNAVEISSVQNSLCGCKELVVGFERTCRSYYEIIRGKVRRVVVSIIIVIYYDCVFQVIGMKIEEITAAAGVIRIRVETITRTKKVRIIMRIKIEANIRGRSRTRPSRIRTTIAATIDITSTIDRVERRRIRAIYYRSCRSTTFCKENTIFNRT